VITGSENLITLFAVLYTMITRCVVLVLELIFHENCYHKNNVKIK
jgi:hypothetical protein